MTQAILQPTAPRTILQITGASLKLYQRGLIKVLPLCALYFVILFALQSFQQMEMTAPSAQGFGLVNFVVAILNFAAQPLIMAAVIFTLHHFATGASIPNFRTSLNFCARRFPTILWGYILYIFAVTLCTVLLVIPGIFVAPLFALFYIFILFEDKTSFQSLKASTQLVWGHWWHTALVLLLCALSYIVLGLLAIVLVLIIDAGLVFILPHLFTHINAGSVAHNFGIIAAMFIVAILFTPLIGSFLLQLYYDLKLRKGLI